MKKIGIMSMQRIINYGSYLQAFGLKKTIEELGYDVEFIDYHYEKSVLKEKSKVFKFLNKISNVIKTSNYVESKKTYINFKKNIEVALKEIGVTNKYNYNHNIDALIIGSDEVFNCIQSYPVGYSRELFGKNYENIDVISYAASFGYTTIGSLKKYHIFSEVSNLLNNFKSISVRDENSKDIAEKLTDKQISEHLDPVLISNYTSYIKKECNLNDFIIIYAYNGRLTKSEEEYIKSFAKLHNKKIVSLGFYQRIADYNLTIHPLAVLDYFDNADFVITDTFHGTVFSIKMNTKFCTLIRNSNANKLNSLLKKLELADRSVKKISDIEKLYNIDINFKETNEILKNERKRTIRYLEKNLKKDDLENE